MNIVTMKSGCITYIVINTHGWIQIPVVIMVIGNCNWLKVNKLAQEF